MKRNLLLLACLLTISLAASAQRSNKKNENFNLLTIPGSAALRPVKNEPKVQFDYKQINAPLPQFEIYNHEGKNTTKDVLETGGNLFVMIFNPTCEHCEDQTLSFIENIFLFKKSKLLLVAAPIAAPYISYFNANVKFSEYPSTMTVSVDSSKTVDKLFNYVSLPQINIYDGSTHRLLKTFNGPQPIDSLKQYIQ